MYKLAILIAIVIAVAVLFLRPKDSKVHISKVNNYYKVKKGNQDLIVDKSDVRYYDNIEEEFKNRRKLYFWETPRPAAPRPTRRIEPQLNEYHVNNYVVRDNRVTPRIDTQNVHDTAVQNKLKQRFKDLHHFDNSTHDVLIQEILAHCNNNSEVNFVLKKLKDRNDTVVNFDTNNELEILKKTWNNGNKLVRDQLINELKDCKSSSNTIYCPTGTATRIMSALYIEDPENFPKDKNTLNQEIMNKCAHLRKTNEEITPEEMKNVIVNEYNGTYDKEFVTNIMDEWINYI